jgi:hypothetical protein
VRLVVDSVNNATDKPQLRRDHGDEGAPEHRVVYAERIGDDVVIEFAHSSFSVKMLIHCGDILV